MTTVIPSASTCYSLQLPPIDKDDRLNLNVRTGSASTLYNSLVMTFGGMTIGLELDALTIDELVEVYILKLLTSKSKRLERYLSGELFILNILDRVWYRVATSPDTPRPSARLFHEVAASNNCLYVFGGLACSENPDDNVPTSWLTPTNDLWEFNLEHNTWRLLDDGSYNESIAKPTPRYNHKMTPLNSLLFLDKPDHHGLLIAGGRDANSNMIYDNYIFDLVDLSYVGTSINLEISTNSLSSDSEKEIDEIDNVDDNYNLNIEYTRNIVVAFDQETQHKHRHNPRGTERKKHRSANDSPLESIIVYAPTKGKIRPDSPNPLLSFRLGRQLKRGKILPLHRKRDTLTTHSNALHTIPYNLRYPTAGVFGKNVVICGFLPNDFNISIFVYNKPTGKWSRLNVFCHHDYGSHRFWGGFVWQSHHKVLLLGNYITSRTTSSIRFFTQMILVSLPITNILASSELAGGHVHEAHGKRVPISDDSSDHTASTRSLDEDANRDQEELDSDLSDHSHAISFSEYVLYAAPKTNFTNISSVFPAAAITLGRNAFDRYGDLISDFELVSSSGDRIPVLMMTLQERWGSYFIDLLSRGYVQAVTKFEKDQREHPNTRQALRTSQASETSSITNSSFQAEPLSTSPPKSFQVQVVHPNSKKPQKDTPQFRYPFQELAQTSQTNLAPPDESETGNTKVAAGEQPAKERPGLVSVSSAVDPHQPLEARRGSTSSYHSQNSLLISQLQDIPPQLPLPNEPIPSVPASLSFRSQSRRGSSDINSPRASLIHTLTTLRNIPVKSPRNSPFASPRASVSNASGAGNSTMSLLSSLEQSNTDNSPVGSLMDAVKGIPRDNIHLSESTVNTTPNSQMRSRADSEILRAESDVEKGLLSNILLDFDDVDGSKFAMEPSLIPRKLYIPFPTATLKAFCEYLYTGQIGNKWLLQPTTLNNLAIARFFKVPLLYDLICEVLFGIIGRKESYVVKEVNKLRKRHEELLKLTNSEPDTDFVSPLEEYQGLMDTVDDGYFDMNLLQKTSNIHKNSLSSRYKSWDSNAPRERSVGMEKGSSDSTDIPSQSGDTEKLEPELDSDFKTPSNSENEDYDFDLAYMVEPESSMPIGPRSKSIFDKMDIPFQRSHSIADEEEDEEADEKARTNHLTLEELVSLDAPVPSDHVLELIHEVGALTTDMKLMLRAANARHMNILLKETQDYMFSRITMLEKKLEEQQRSAEEIESELDINDSESELASHDFSELKTTRSSTSLHTLGSFRTTPLDRSKTSNLRSIGGLTPFRMTKSESKKSMIGENKEVDKRINKLVKQDQKLKKQQLEREKAKPHTRGERSHSKTDHVLTRHEAAEKPKPPSRAQTASSIPYNDVQSVSSLDTTNSKKKKHHGIFHHLSSHKLSKKATPVKGMSPMEVTPPTDDSELIRSLSALSLSLNTSRKSDKKKGFGLFKKSS